MGGDRLDMARWRLQMRWLTNQWKSERRPSVLDYHVYHSTPAERGEWRELKDISDYPVFEVPGGPYDSVVHFIAQPGKDELSDDEEPAPADSDSE